MAKKYVIVGANIDIYKEYSEIPGAKKSALDWKLFLDKAGFIPNEILTDKNASRKNILSALTNLFANLEKDDFAAFIYIGHGKQTKITGKNYTVTQDEDDERDETLICNGTSIIDDEIRILLNLNKNHAPVFILIDACYNGLIERKYKISTNLSLNNEIAFSSATQLQKAFMEDYTHVQQAIYSSFLLKILSKNIDKNYNEIFDLTREELKKEGYTQNPQLAFTNYDILQNQIFSTPANVPELKFSPGEFKAIENDPNKGQTGVIMEWEEKIMAYLKNFKTFKTNNYGKF